MSELIFVEQKPIPGKEHPSQPGTTIGREGCDINIADPEVSRRHATIREEGGQVSIEDLGSTNGTYVNGERITGLRALRAGDEVRFGNTVWRLVAPAAETAASDVPAAAAPQVTAARPIPEAPAEPPQAPPAPPPPTPAPQAPATAQQPAAAPPAAPPPPTAGGRRGDVPEPDFQPSAIRRVVPPPGGPAAFAPPPPPRVRGSAATRLGATVAATALVALTAIGVVLYYIVEPFELRGPEGAIQSFAKAVADGDGQAACDELTAEAQRAVRSDAGGQANCPRVYELASDALSEDEKDELRDVDPKDVEEDGDRATAKVDNLSGGGESEIKLVREDGDWKISDPG